MAEEEKQAEKERAKEVRVGFVVARTLRGNVTLRERAKVRKFTQPPKLGTHETRLTIPRTHSPPVGAVEARSSEREREEGEDG